MVHRLQWQKFHPLSDNNAFICLVDHMGDDSSIVQAARVSYDGDVKQVYDEAGNFIGFEMNSTQLAKLEKRQKNGLLKKDLKNQLQKDRQLIRYLMNHSHTTPFEMVEIKFMVQVPMDCWRQWVRHRTASINEYSTRYTEAIDAMQTTSPTEWRLQATDNKQGSSGYLDADLGELLTPQEAMDLIFNMDEYIESSKTPAQYVLSNEERIFHKLARKLYELRLKFGIAKEQARKDLPLSTYTRAYWKCDLHNIFNFLRLRMDSHAQLEIRSFANSMFEIVKGICPVACEAFEDYVLNARRFSRMEMEVLQVLLARAVEDRQVMQEFSYDETMSREEANTEWGSRLRQAIQEIQFKPDSLTDREWKEFLNKL